MPATLGFEQKLAADWPLDRWRDVRVLVAVSGGADSVAVLRALARLNGSGTANLKAAHYNHRLRASADVDALFVSNLCQQLGIECISGQADKPAAQGGSECAEAAARAARYEFLTSSAEAWGARYVVTGHTADDQAETILHHILRGTGLRGLAGMPRARLLSPAVTLLRPALQATRQEVLEYLASLEQPFQQDETNLEPRYLRNRIRLELLPQLARDYAPSIIDSLLRLGALAGDAQRVIDAESQALLDRCLAQRQTHQLVFDCRALQGCDAHLVREMLITAWREQGWRLQAMGHAQWHQLCEMALAESGDAVAKQVLPGAITAQRRGTQLELAAAPPD